eukprot:CCRYP_012296-RA/>CCRYP_012296-RA protein AED:0.45 eAED:0.45 QI:0/-1/0/1/-1/1/1/0/103
MAQVSRPPKRSRTANGSSLPTSSEQDDASSLDPPQILLTSRDNDFSAVSWWMVDMECTDDDGNEGSKQGATLLVKRCMRAYHWDLRTTRRVLQAYRQFLFLKK